MKNKKKRRKNRKRKELKGSCCCWRHFRFKKNLFKFIFIFKKKI